MTENPYLATDGSRLIVTDQGRKYLDRLVTDTEGPVYAFTEQAPPLMVAAAMARLSRRGSDLREIYLDEFAVDEEYSAELIRRVVTAYGDDSVQQLVGLQFVVEDASNLLTKALEWGRLAAYLEQSTRYIYYDQRDAAGCYKYYTPLNLTSDLAETYRQELDAIFDLYSEMVRGLTDYVRQRHPQGEDPRAAWLGATRAQACDAVRPVLPVATKSTVGIFASAQAVDYLVMRLLSEDLEEFRLTGQQILKAARQVIGVFLERTDLPERGGAMTAYKANTRQTIRELAGEYLKPQIEPPQAIADLLPRMLSPEVILHDYWPRDELELVPEMLYAETGLSIDQLSMAASGWPQEAKERIFTAYVGERLNRRHKPGRAMEKAHYEWQIHADYGTFRDIQRHRMVDAFEWQQLTPSYGYETPPLVTEAGYERQFDECFNRSEALYRLMAASGFAGEAQYAVLLGHRMRYRFITNLREAYHLIELRTQPAGHPGYRRIAQKMHEEIARVHPLAAAGMRFVNQDEDEKLTRLAAERATQFKLERLSAKD